MHNKNAISNLLLKFPSLSVELIYKDIYLSEIMEYIVNIFDNKSWQDNYFLCGGTSLSKCYTTTNRLSEDIDITIFGLSLDQGKKSFKKYLC